MNQLSEQTATTYPFPDGESDVLQQRFSIEPRQYSVERKEAAAMAWHTFCLKPLDAGDFVRMISVCDGNLTEATVLFDALKFHRAKGLVAFVERSTRSYLDEYEAPFTSKSGCHRAVSGLSAQGLIVAWPTAPGAAFKFRLDWIDLSERLAELGNKMPGLMNSESGELS